MGYKTEKKIPSIILSVFIVLLTPFTKESFAARYPGKPYSEAANLEMLKFFEQI